MGEWVLYDEQADVYAGLGEDGSITLEESPEAALVFDHRDNPRIKVAFYNATTGYRFAAKQV